MKSRQFSIPFEFQEIPKEKSKNYWQKYFGFTPKVGEFATIGETIAFCDTIGKNSYCYCMHVEIIEIVGDKAKVMTTKKWQDACGGASGANTAGTMWTVDVNNLAPYFERKKQLKTKT